MAAGYLAGAIAGLVMAQALTTSALAGPAIASDWADLQVPHAECLDRGETAIRRLGFGSIERTRYSVYGQLDDYTVAVRCVAEKGVMLFLASGPYRERALNYQVELHRNFMK
jgi:hypothetical protein